MSVNDLRVGKFNRTKKISDETRTLILKWYEEGHTIAEISREFGVSWTSVKCIVDPVYYIALIVAVLIIMVACYGVAQGKKKNDSKRVYKK